MPIVHKPSPVVNAVHATATDSNGRAQETPEISGAVVGSVIGFAWLVGGIYYLWKLWQRSRSVRRAGLKSHRELLDLPPKSEEYIIPPDPAVIQGVRLPGEEILNEKRKHGGRRALGLSLSPAESMPAMEEEGSLSPATPDDPHYTAPGHPMPSIGGEKGLSPVAESLHAPQMSRRESGFPFGT